ncbi:MAG: hypothetical protein V4538_02475 [Bacteroidota bacterium]
MAEQKEKEGVPFIQNYMDTLNAIAAGKKTTFLLLVDKEVITLVKEFGAGIQGLSKWLADNANNTNFDPVVKQSMEAQLKQLCELQSEIQSQIILHATPVTKQATA